MVKKLLFIFLWSFLVVIILAVIALNVFYLSIPDRKKEFNKNHIELMEVVAMIQKGEVKVQNYGTYDLSEKNKHLTVFGRISIKNAKDPLVIIFPTSKKKDDFDAYIYASDDKYPIIKSRSGKTFLVHRWEKDWFYLDSLETNNKTN